jgi:spore germination cell wall hydrolase CwlJ-like protein
MTPLTCLVAAIFFEARDQPLLGMEMVAQVVINRVEHDRYPDDVCSVVYQPEQFSFTIGGHPKVKTFKAPDDRRAARMAREVASRFLGGDTTGNPSTHYHTTSVSPWWKYEFTLDGRVGDHIFYTCSAYC